MDPEKINYQSIKIVSNKPLLFFIAAIFLFATTLRTPITIVGPIISFIREGLEISNVLAGFLTTIPLLAFAVIFRFFYNCKKPHNTTKRMYPFMLY